MQQCAIISRRSGAPPGFRRIQQLGIQPKGDRLPMPILQIPHPCRGMGQMQRPISRGLAHDPLAFDHTEHLIRGRSQKLNQTVASLFPHLCNNRFWGQPKPGIDQPHIPPRTAETNRIGFEQGNRYPLPCGL